MISFPLPLVEQTKALAWPPWAFGPKQISLPLTWSWSPSVVVPPTLRVDSNVVAPEALNVPLTSNLWVGSRIPIPTLPPGVILILSVKAPAAILVDVGWPKLELFKSSAVINDKPPL